MHCEMLHIGTCFCRCGGGGGGGGEGLYGVWIENICHSGRHSYTYTNTAKCFAPDHANIYDYE